MNYFPKNSTQETEVVVDVGINASQRNILIFIIFIYFCNALLTFFYSPIALDAANVYLPFAKKILDEGIGFLFSQESIVTSPISFLWPALFGGEHHIVKFANLIAGVFMVLLVYGIGRRLYSRSSGLIAAGLFAASPLMCQWIPTSLSEPPFFLFTLLWFWGLLEINAGKQWAIPVAALALSASILTRGVWLYPAIIFIILLLAFYIFKLGAAKKTGHLLIACISGLVLPLLFIVKNFVLFGLPAIDTGSGGALFFGTHLLTNGFEPLPLGLSYEHGSNMRTVVGSGQHAAVAMEFLNSRSISELLHWYLTKISWVTLFSVTDKPIAVSIWRCVELAGAITAFVWALKQRYFLVIVLAAGVVLQILQTALVLYNIRYSIDNLELLLIPLASVGIALAFNRPYESRMGIAGDFGPKYGYIFNQYAIQLIAIATMLFLVSYLRPAPAIHLPAHIPVSVLFESNETKVIKSAASAGSLPSDSPSSVSLQWYVPAQVLPSGTSNALWKITLSVASNTGRCHKASLSFATLLAPHDESTAVRFPVHGDGQSYTYLLGTAVMNAHLFPMDSGKLTLALDCDNDAKITVKNIALVAPHIIETYFGKFNQ